MSLTTSIIVNALLDVLVIVALFRLMWFGISKPYDEPSELRQHELPGATEHERRAA